MMTEIDWEDDVKEFDGIYGSNIPHKVISSQIQK